MTKPKHLSQWYITHRLQLNNMRMCNLWPCRFRVTLFSSALQHHWYIRNHQIFYIFLPYSSIFYHIYHNIQIYSVLRTCFSPQEPDGTWAATDAAHCRVGQRLAWATWSHIQWQGSKFITHVTHVFITIWLFNIAMENNHFLVGKPSINGPFSMAMLNNQRVYSFKIRKIMLWDVMDVMSYDDKYW